MTGWEEHAQRKSLDGEATKQHALLFPVALDWRRDFYEQAEHVYRGVMTAKEGTGCNPIVVGLSFGGLLAYTAFTRYGRDFARHVHGVLYAAAYLQPRAVKSMGTS